MCCRLGHLRLFSPEKEPVISLELTSLCKRQLRPQTWKFKSGKSSRSIFPSTPTSIHQLKYSSQLEKLPSLTERQLRILRKRRLLPYFRFTYLQPISSGAPSKMETPSAIWKLHTIKRPPLTRCLNKVLTGAKNLKSLIVESGDRINNFKVIRKGRRLLNVELMLKTSQIMQYPQLFKHLNALEKVTLYVKGSIANEEKRLLDKFFGFLIDQPKLKHLTVWFEESGDYYKTLLSAIHARNLASFHVIACNADISKCHLDWGKSVDTLYIGPIPSLQNHPGTNQWPPVKEPEKRLRLNTVPENDDLLSEIKNLEIVNFLYLSSENQNIFWFIAQIKALENLKLAFEETLPINNHTYDDFNSKFSQIESLETLQTFAFSLHKKEKSHGKISAPFGNQMKNLKSLSLDIVAYYFDFSDFTEALRELFSLEKLNFKYKELGKQDLSLDCDFPFENLRNLKAISLESNIRFSKTSKEQLVDGISQLENLETLKIEGEIFDGLVRKKASVLIGSFWLMRRLEVASFAWKDAEASHWTRVNMKEVNGEITVSSGRKV